MATKTTYPCDVDSCGARATFVNREMTVLACTRHARKGFTLYPTVIQQAMGANPVYYREGLGNLTPITAVVK